MSVLHRRAVRVLLVDEQGAVLMIHGYDPHHPQQTYWYTIGGGLEDGEDERAAAVRETWEETGLRVERAALLGPVHQDEISFGFEGRQVRQRQLYFGLLTARFVPAPAALAELEVRSTIELGWVDPSTSGRGEPRVYPAELGALVQAVRSAAREASTRAPESQNWL